MQHMGHNNYSNYKLANFCYGFIFVTFHDNKPHAKSLSAFTDIGMRVSCPYHEYVFIAF